MPDRGPPQGTVVMDSTPTHRKTSAMPASICAAATWMACIDDPNEQDTVIPVVSMGNPASRLTTRARLPPCTPSAAAQPRITCCTSFGSSFMRPSSPRTTWAARTSGRQDVRTHRGESTTASEMER